MEATSVRPCAAVPVTSGSAAGSGLPSRSLMIGAPTTTSVRAVTTWTVATGFDTVITTRSREPRSASVSRYWLEPPHGASEEHVCAPVGVRGTARGGSALTGTQSARFPSSGQRCHWWVIASGGCPGEACPETRMSQPSSCRGQSCRSPLVAVRPGTLTGPPRTGGVGGSPVTTAMPTPLFAVTRSRSVEPRSALVGVYRDVEFVLRRRRREDIGWW